MSHMSELDAAGITTKQMADHMKAGGGFEEGLRAIPGKVTAKMNRRSLKRALVKATSGCNIQHTGWPCNSCFHSLDLELKEDIHEYWLAVLAYRGDYPDEPQRPDLLAELWAAVKDV